MTTQNRLALMAGTTAFAALCLPLTARAQTQLLANGGFETGDFTGWTTPVQ